MVSTQEDDKKKTKRFPLRLETEFSSEIDDFVFYTDAQSKHQYIIDAVKEKMARDRALYLLRREQVRNRK